MNRFVAAVRFLTIVPVPGKMGHDEAALTGSLPYFPVIGLLIGAVAAGLALILQTLFAPLVVSMLTVIILLAASGGLHMDGLCDSADGFFSARPREQMLQIMRDSRVGTMGVLAIVLVIGIKVTALASLDESSFSTTVFLMPVAGRCTLLVLMAILPYVRPEGGLATLFYTRGSRMASLWGMSVFLLTGWLVAGPAGFIAGLIVFGFVLLFAVYCRHKIGGATGDTLGAGCELAEVMVALVLAAEPVKALLR